MAKYMFSYSVIPTDDSWWCTIQKERDSVSADNLKDAIDKFVEVLDDRWCIEVSKTAKKNPQKMYKETAKGDYQCGLVFKGSKEIEGKVKAWVKKYANIWCEITTLSYPTELSNFGIL